MTHATRIKRTNATILLLLLWFVLAVVGAIVIKNRIVVVAECWLQDKRVVVIIAVKIRVLVKSMKEVVKS